ncbi:MAG: packaged DNA stabilization protein, partial [Rickettsiales bacterium]
MQIPLIKGDKVDGDVDYRDALPVNMTAINHPIKGADGYMFQWYGLSLYASGEGVDRGARWVSASGLEGHYRVSGESFLRVNGDGTTTVLGAIPGEDQARIAFSFNNIAIVANKALYYYNPDDGLREIADPDIGSPIDIVWADSYFILTDGADVYHSDILDEESYNPLNFTNPQFRPDSTFGLGINEDNELVVYGVSTTQYYTNQGLENFTYANITLKALKQGILGTHCKAEMNGKWYCISRREESSPSVTIVQGGGFKRISTREIDKILSSYSEGALSSSVVESIVDD